MHKLLLIFICTGIAGYSAETIDAYTQKDIASVQNDLAHKKTAFASRDLKRYGNHYTMLAYRESTGSSEIHQHEADVFIVQEGDAMLVTGGKMIDGRLQKPGEIRGTSVEGGDKRPLKTGDIVHIPAGVPHQILVTPGKPITYFVVKVTGQ